MARQTDDDYYDDLVGDAPTSDGKARPNRKKDDDDDVSVASGQLRAFIERIERLEEDKAAIAADIKEVYAELKGAGFDSKAVRTIVRLRKRDQAEIDEEQAIVELYMQALGMH